jgi:diguanylate cyclase
VFNHHHNAIFAALSLIVAILGSWTALDLFRRVRSHIGRARRVWLYTAAVAMGLSIWSMHFLAMLGFDPGSPVGYDPVLTALSLALAIGATLAAFVSASVEAAKPFRVLTAGAAMGGGICLMHYVGMAALRSAVSLGYRVEFVIASLVIAVGASTAALFAARRERSLGWRALAAVILGLAIVGMHYTAMAGLQLTPIGGPSAALGASPLVLGVGVASGSLLILFLALLASLYDERLNVLSALEAGEVGYWELYLPDMVLHVSAKAKEIMGREPNAPFTHDDLIASFAPDEPERRERLLAEAMEGGAVYDAEYQIRTPTGEERWINIRGRVAGGAGRVRRLIGVVMDVSDRRRAFAAVADAERRQRILIDELNHRVKNTLATVQSLARQTGKGAQSISQFQGALDARLVALSHTHNALTRGGWETAALRELLEQELSPYARDQVSASGPDVQLRPRETLALGMVFHELATNAAKYGALSLTDGSVKVSWANPPGGKLSITWREEGGPPVTPPQRTGFGSRLIKATIERELAGTLELTYAPEGFRAAIVIPLSADTSPSALGL